MAQLEQDYKQLEKGVQNAPKSDVEVMKGDIEEQSKTLKEYKEDLKHVNQIIVFGVCVLLVMVAALMATVLINYINSFDNNTNAIYQWQENGYQLLEQRVTTLEKKGK